jgi:hypothetical protein
MHSMTLSWIPKHPSAFDDIISVLSTNVDGIFVSYMYFWKVMTSSRKIINAIFWIWLEHEAYFMRPTMTSIFNKNITKLVCFDQNQDTSVVHRKHWKNMTCQIPNKNVHGFWDFRVVHVLSCPEDPYTSQKKARAFMQNLKSFISLHVKTAVFFSLLISY